MIAILLAIGLQAAAQPTVAELAQREIAAANKSNECFQMVATRWWTLADDARSIADGALYLCDDFLDDEARAFRNELLARLMSENASTVGLDEAVAEHKRAVRERSRTGVVAVVLKKRSDAAAKQP